MTRFNTETLRPEGWRGEANTVKFAFASISGIYHFRKR
jgi:hypothetical protein